MNDLFICCRRKYPIPTAVVTQAQLSTLFITDCMCPNMTRYLVRNMMTPMTLLPSQSSPVINKHKMTKCTYFRSGNHLIKLEQIKYAKMTFQEAIYYMYMAVL